MIRFLFLGLGLGGIYALAGQGLVLVYRGSGVLNFAQGAFAAVGALAYYDLHVRAGLPTVPSVVVALLISGVAGLLMHFLVMRPLRNAPPLTRVIATLGVMVMLQQLGRIVFGSSIRIVPSFLPSKSIDIGGGAAVGLDRFVLLGLAVVVSATLWAVYRYSKFGAITSAVAENERAAQLAGHSPDVIAAVNWALGAMLAGLAGILIAPIAGLDINTLVLLIIPALATAMVARFDSFVGALIASLVIGIAQSEITNYVRAAGWGDAVPFLLVILVLVARGQSLPLRSHVNELLPEIGTGVLRPTRLAVAVAAGVVLILTTPNDWSDALTATTIGAIICVSLVVVTGYAGQLSLAQYAFAGWGGYVASRLAATHGLPFLLALVIGVAAAVPVGVLVGLPALRTRGIHLAIATFGLAYSFQSILFQSVPLTGGLEGTVVNPPTLFGWDIDAVNHPKRYAIVCLVALLLAALVAGNIRRGRSGRRLVAVRGNERAAASLGISVYGAKLYSFALSAAIAGLGGVLLAFQASYVDFSQYNVFNSISVIINTVISGVGFLVGTVLAGANVTGGVTTKIFGEVFTSSSINQYVTLALAVLLVPTLVGYPNGLAARIVTLRWSRVRLPLRRAAAADGAPSDGSPADWTKSDAATSEGTTSEGATAKAPRSEALPAEVAHLVAAAAASPAVPRRVTPRVLEVQDVSVRFGGVQALGGVSIDVRPGEVVGVMGPNGAGKTTFIDAVTGFNRIGGGTILLDGVRIDGMNARKRARLGIGRTFQSLELFDQLSVLENLRTASDPRDSASYLSDLVVPRRTELTPAARSAIAMFELAGDLHRVPSELPYGRRRQVAIARAIAAEPSILLLDEPAAGLHETETQELSALVRRLVDEWGIGILLVEHDVAMLNRVCDRIVVMDFGKVIATGTPAEIRDDPRVVAAYLGEERHDEPDDESSAGQEQQVQEQQVREQEVVGDAR
ncbi:ATP-binding cassette domain-containing protein [Frankia sp. AgB1.9]|uniref:branched-chain amino acid ABC transporter permease/ATP-binding protein n=1 Tax=unclassified Frankia TaxID=2632575 RepID=UPI001931675F|nr:MULTISPECIES: branched-chain amino acid ABC transporter permease/ATP-binding protein [unclassified Frankia]MBL7492401.1 ATP-binding cassette domain-containing protein [Frankia sp. AgW1.1]MBL7548871.1 ATP-binding cassette domain-containing protein [Frankia sp. AgB1.9]MBL7619708.1 ATP-binding cassette domain-containing protein [Frankia sp. AgB1.8]